MKKVAVYPGSFDPITNGHIDILKRALNIFDEVIVLIAYNNAKSGCFSPTERKEMIEEAIEELGIKGAVVDITDGLTVKYALEHNATHLIRGLRAVTDFEYEFKLNAGNKFVEKTIDSVFFMTDNDYEFISSSSVIELHNGGVDVSPLVPKSVLKRLK